MDQKKIKVLVVDDSEVSRKIMQHIVERDPSLKVVGMCCNGSEAIDWLASNSADVITMDIVMPKMNGFETTRKIMETQPVPIVIVTSMYTSEDAELSFRAIEAGALAILEKPSGPSDPLYLKKVQEINQIIKTIKDVKLIKLKPVSKSKSEVKIINNLEAPSEISEHFESVAIGASIGGPAALMNILSQLTPSFPVPIFIVQHIVSGFTEGLASWLQGYSNLNIVLPKDGSVAQPGVCYIAPDNYHMEIRPGNIISLNDKGKDEIKPSVSRLFKSVAETYGKKAVGLILTGMGRDGANELLLMKQKGAYTIAQDEKSCVVFGMPGEAIKLGAACKVLPLDQIPGALNNLMIKKCSVLNGGFYGR